MWSDVLGKTVRYTGADMDAFEETARKRGPSSYRAFAEEIAAEWSKK